MLFLAFWSMFNAVNYTLKAHKRHLIVLQYVKNVPNFLLEDTNFQLLLFEVSLGNF